MISGQLALIIAALFAGASLYVSVAEQPARRMLDDRAALAQWRPAYKRGFAIQAPLAIVGFVFGFMAWRQTGESHWLIGAAILIANWPYTMIAMLRLNKQLLAIEPAAADADSSALLRKWGNLHAVRTALGFAALTVFLQASLAG
jgi:hypothetical protein